MGRTFEEAVDRNFHNHPLQFTTFCQPCSAAGGSLSMCFRNRARDQICWSVSVHFHDGIPVHRMPCLVFQNKKLSGSSSSPSTTTRSTARHYPNLAPSCDLAVISPPVPPAIIVKKWVARIRLAWVHGLEPLTIGFFPRHQAPIRRLYDNRNADVDDRLSVRNPATVNIGLTGEPDDRLPPRMLRATRAQHGEGRRRLLPSTDRLASRLCRLIVPDKRVQVGVVVQDQRIAPPAITVRRSITLAVIRSNTDPQLSGNVFSITIELFSKKQLLNIAASIIRIYIRVLRRQVDFADLRLDFLVVPAISVNIPITHRAEDTDREGHDYIGRPTFRLY